MVTASTDPGYTVHQPDGEYARQRRMISSLNLDWPGPISQRPDQQQQQQQQQSTDDLNCRHGFNVRGLEEHRQLVQRYRAPRSPSIEPTSIADDDDSHDFNGLQQMSEYSNAGDTPRKKQEKKRKRRTKQEKQQKRQRVQGDPSSSDMD